MLDKVVSRWARKKKEGRETSCKYQMSKSDENEFGTAAQFTPDAAPPFVPQYRFPDRMSHHLLLLLTSTRCPGKLPCDQPKGMANS